GVFLHDSGKVRELSYARTFAYSDEGQLLGHLTIGIEMLADKARQVPDLTGEPFPAEVLLRLKHLILSHHGELEYGSPKVPVTSAREFRATLRALIREGKAQVGRTTPFWRRRRCPAPAAPSSGSRTATASSASRPRRACRRRNTTSRTTWPGTRPAGTRSRSRS